LALLADDGRVSVEMADQATFRLGEQNAFAWAQAWQKGQLGDAMKALKIAVEDDPDAAPLMLLSQARKEVERLCCLEDARRLGLRGQEALGEALGLRPNQYFLLDSYSRVLDRLRGDDLKKLVALVSDADSDIKGGALSKSPTPLMNLTMMLFRAWRI
jgi:DNA polymerase III delta subunit